MCYALNLAEIKEGMNILDYGCGREKIVYQCAKRRANCIGIDYSESAINLAKITLQNLREDEKKRAKLLLFGINYNKLPFNSDYFERVFLI